MHRHSFNIYLFLLCALFAKSISQPNPDKPQYPEEKQIEVLNTIVTKHFGYGYFVSDFVDVNCIISGCNYSYYRTLYIEEDKLNQYQNSYIVIVKFNTEGLNSDSLYIAIINNQKLTWFSKPLYFDYPNLTISGIGDMNNDGVTDILFSNPLGAKNDYEGLWIISPNVHGGVILNTIQNKKISDLFGVAGSFVIDTQYDGSKIISSYNSVEADSKIIKYSWNGKSFTEMKDK